MSLASIPKAIHLASTGHLEKQGTLLSTFPSRIRREPGCKAMGEEYSSRRTDKLPPVEPTSASIAEYLKMNKKITSLAANTKNVVRSSGRGSPKAESVIEGVLNQFELVGKHPEALSHVNASTLLHRCARIASFSIDHEKLWERNPRLLEYLVDAIYQWHNMFDPRHTASAIWSFGLLGRQMLSVHSGVASFPLCFSCLLEKAEAQAELFSAKEVASILNGIANLELRVSTCEKLIKALLRTTEDKLGTFYAQELATCIWALAKIEYSFEDDSQHLLDLIVARFKVQMDADSVQDRELASFLWGIANLGYEDTLGFCSPATARVVERLPLMKAQSLSTAIWALGNLRYLPSERHLQVMAKVVSKKMRFFNPIHVAKVLHAFAGFGRPFDSLISGAKAYLETRISQFGRQELCNVLWSLAILEGLDKATFKQSVEAMEKYPSLSIDKMSSSELRQLYTCLIHIRSFCENGDGHANLPPEWEALCEKEYASGQEEKKTYSVALAVMLTLQEMGNVCQNHSLHAESSKVLDLVLTVNGVRVAIEVSIPTHYFINSTHELRGPRLWAIKILEAQGLIVLRIDCRHWNKLRPEFRMAYIQDRLGLASQLN